jgi:chromosome segregation ATPase
VRPLFELTTSKTKDLQEEVASLREEMLSLKATNELMLTIHPPTQPSAEEVTQGQEEEIEKLREEIADLQTQNAQLQLISTQFGADLKDEIECATRALASKTEERETERTEHARAKQDLREAHTQVQHLTELGELRSTELNSNRQLLKENAQKQILEMAAAKNCEAQLERIQNDFGKLKRKFDDAESELKNAKKEKRTLEVELTMLRCTTGRKTMSS